MRKEELIKKWLDGTLNDAELEQFKKVDEYRTFIKIDKTAKLFKSDSYNTSNEYLKLRNKLPKIKNRFKPYLQVAAAILIGFSLYFSITNSKLTSVETLTSEKLEVNLPDESIVFLNASSTLKYNKSKWKNERTVELKGEAFFKVAKGSNFDVKTNNGIVSVLGTHFNVKNRKNFFEVTCYEGLVSVNNNNKIIKLPAGNSIRYLDNTSVASLTNATEPSWNNNVSDFKSIPFIEVIKEFERQYGVTLVYQNIDTNQLFTGSFTHNDINTSLKSITLPLHLNFEIKGTTIKLTKE